MKRLFIGSLIIPFLCNAMEIHPEQSFMRISPIEIQAQVSEIVSPQAMCLTSADPSNLYERYASEIYKIREMLFNDRTDAIPYELGHFTCHNYAKRLYLQNSNQVESLESFNITDMEREWGTTIKRRDGEKFEMYTITLTSPEEGYFHAINAVLLDKENPDNINSYIFIEPQSDKIMLADELREHSNRLMRKTMTAPITIDVSTFDRFTFNGNIWQTFETTKVKFTDR